MICPKCAQAADYGRTDLHKLCVPSGCDCHHRPIEGEPRLSGELPDYAYEAKHPGAYRARECLHCGKAVALNKDGRMRRHKGAAIRGHVCPGSGVNYV